MAIVMGSVCGAVGLLCEQIRCAPEPRSAGEREYRKGRGTIDARLVILMEAGRLPTSAHCGIVHLAGEKQCPV